MFGDSAPFVSEPRLQDDRVLHKVVSDPTQQEIRYVPVALVLHGDTTLFLLFTLMQICRLKVLAEPSIYRFSFMLVGHNSFLFAQPLVEGAHESLLLSFGQIGLLVPFDLVCFLDRNLDFLLKSALTLLKAHTQRFPQACYTLFDS